MRSKLASIIVSTTLVAVALLVVRQQRLQAVYEMTHALNRASEDDRGLWQLRLEIAQRVRPEALRALVENPEEAPEASAP